MKRVLTGAFAVMLIIALAACAGKKEDQTVRVKCPACGYEFTAPTE